MTSHSSQDQTADRVILVIDGEHRQHFVNQRLAYVAISRGQSDVQIYTDGKTQLVHLPHRRSSHAAALEPGRNPDVFAPRRAARRDARLSA